MSNYEEEVKTLRKHVSGRVQHLVGLFGKKAGTESERQTSDPSKGKFSLVIYPQISPVLTKLQTHFTEKKNELALKRSTSIKEEKEAGKKSYKAVPSHDPVYQRAVRLRAEQRSAELEAKASLLKFTQSAKSRVDTHAEELRRQEQRYREQEAAAKRSLEKNTGGAVFSQGYMKAKEIATYSRQKETEAKKALQQFHHYDYSHKIIHVNGIPVPRDPDEHNQYFPPQKYNFLSSPQIRSASKASASRALESFVGGFSEEESKKQNDAVYGKNLEIYSPIAVKTDNTNVVGGNYLWENERKSYTLCSPRSSEERSRFSFDSVPLNDAEEKEKVDGTIRTRSRKKSDVRSLYELQITQTMRKGTLQSKRGNGSEERTLKDGKEEIQEVGKEEICLTVDDPHVNEEGERCEDADDVEEAVVKTEECVSSFQSVVTSTESTAFGSEDEAIDRDEEVEEERSEIVAEMETAQHTSAASDIVMEEVEAIETGESDGKLTEEDASEMEMELKDTQMEQSTSTASHMSYSQSYSYEKITTTTSVSKVSSFTKEESVRKVMADDVQISQVDSAVVSEAVQEAATFAYRENVDSIALETHSEDNNEGIDGDIGNGDADRATLIEEIEESECDAEDREMKDSTEIMASQSAEVEHAVVDCVSATVDASVMEEAAEIEERLNFLTHAKGESVEAEAESISAHKVAEAIGSQIPEMDVTESVRTAKDVVETEKVEEKGENACESDAEVDFSLGNDKIVAISWHMEHILKEAIHFMDFKYGNRNSVQGSASVFESNASSVASDATAASDELTKIKDEIEVKTTASTEIIDTNAKVSERGTLQMVEDVKREEDVVDVTRNGFVGVSWCMSQILETTVTYMEMKVTLERESMDVEEGITEKQLEESAEEGDSSSDVEEMDAKVMEEEFHNVSEIEIVKDVCHVKETKASRTIGKVVEIDSMAIDDRAITASWHMQHILEETIKYMEVKYSVDTQELTLISSEGTDETESDERIIAKHEIRVESIENDKVVKDCQAVENEKIISTEDELVVQVDETYCAIVEDAQVSGNVSVTSDVAPEGSGNTQWDASNVSVASESEYNEDAKSNVVADLDAEDVPELMEGSLDESVNGSIDTLAGNEMEAIPCAHEKADLEMSNVAEITKHEFAGASWFMSQIVKITVEYMEMKVAMKSKSVDVEGAEEDSEKVSLSCEKIDESVQKEITTENEMEEIAEGDSLNDVDRMDTTDMENVETNQLVSVAGTKIPSVDVETIAINVSVKSDEEESTSESDNVSEMEKVEDGEVVETKVLSTIKSDVEADSVAVDDRAITPSSYMKHILEETIKYMELKYSDDTQQSTQISETSEHSNVGNDIESDERTAAEHESGVEDNQKDVFIQDSLTDNQYDYNDMNTNTEDEMVTQVDVSFDEAESETKLIEEDTKESAIVIERPDVAPRVFGAFQPDHNEEKTDSVSGLMEGSLEYSAKSLDASTGSEMEAILFVQESSELANDNVQLDSNAIEKADSEMLKRNEVIKEEKFVGASWHMSEIVEITVEYMEMRVTMDSESIDVEEVTTEKQLEGITGEDMTDMEYDQLLAIDDTRPLSVDVEAISENVAVTSDEDESVQSQLESGSENVSRIEDQVSITNEVDAEIDSVAVDGRAITASWYMQHILEETIKYMEVKFTTDTQESTLLSQTNESSDVVDVTSDEIEEDAIESRNEAESSDVALQEDSTGSVAIVSQSDDNEEEAESNVVADLDVKDVSGSMQGLLDSVKTLDTSKEIEIQAIPCVQESSEEMILADSNVHEKVHSEIFKTKEDVVEFTKDEFVGVSWHMAQILEITVEFMENALHTIERSEAVNEDNEEISPLIGSIHLSESTVQNRLGGIAEVEKAVNDAEEEDANDMEDVAYSVAHSSTVIGNDDMDSESAPDKSDEEVDTLNESQLETESDTIARSEQENDVEDEDEALTVTEMIVRDFASVEFATTEGEEEGISMKMDVNDSSDETRTMEMEFIGVSWHMTTILKTTVEFLESKRIHQETIDINKAHTEEIAAASDEAFKLESNALDQVSTITEIVLEEIVSTENISTLEESTIIAETTESVPVFTTEVSGVENVETSQFVSEVIVSNTVVDEEAVMTFEGVSWHMEHILQRTFESMSVENVTEGQNQPNDVPELDNVEVAESEQLVKDCVNEPQFVCEDGEVEEMIKKVDFDIVDEVVVSDHSDASEAEEEVNVADELLARDIFAGAYMPTILSKTIEFMNAWTRKDIQMEASSKVSETPHFITQTEEVHEVDDSPSIDAQSDIEAEDGKSEKASDDVEIAEAERLEHVEMTPRITHSLDVIAFGEALESDTETISLRDRIQSEEVCPSGDFKSTCTGEMMQAERMEEMQSAYGSNGMESFEYESIAVETVTTSVTTVTTTNWETQEDTSDDDRYSSPAVAVFLDEIIERIDVDESSESVEDSTIDDVTQHTEIHTVREIAQEFVQSIWNEVIHAVSVGSIDTEGIVNVSGDENVLEAVEETQQTLVEDVSDDKELTNASKVVVHDNANENGSGRVEVIIPSSNDGLTTQDAMFVYEHSEFEHVTIDAMSVRKEEIVQKESGEFLEYEETTTTINSVSKTICETVEFEQMEESNRFTELSPEAVEHNPQSSMMEGAAREKTEIPESVSSEMVSRTVEELVDDSVRMSQETFDDEQAMTSDALETGNIEENVTKAVGQERMEEAAETVVVADEMIDTPSDTSESVKEKRHVDDAHDSIAASMVDEIITIIKDETQVDFMEADVDAETPNELASIRSHNSNVIATDNVSASSQEINSHTQIETEESMTVANLEAVSSELIHVIVDDISETDSDTKCANHPGDHETFSSEPFDRVVEEGSLHASDTKVVSQCIVTMESTTSVQHTSIRSISSVSTIEMNDEATHTNVSSALQETTSFSSEQFTQSESQRIEIIETSASGVNEKDIASRKDELDDDEAGDATGQDLTPRRSSLDEESNEKPTLSQSRGSFGSFLKSFNLLGSSGRRRSEPTEKEPIQVNTDAEASIVAISDIDSEEYHDSKDEQDACEKEKLEYQELPSARDSIERGSFSSFEGSSSGIGGIGGLSSPIPQNLSTFHDPTPASVADFLMETQSREQRPLVQDDLRTLDTHENVNAVESSEAKVSEGSRDNIPSNEENSEAVESKSASKSRFGSFKSSSIAKKFGWKRASGSKDTREDGSI
uniref:AlNc14C74G5013 protein n=1 Tax=Albugo laibachii Nc14 TaxID=890382 RepID=F0WEF7_9STRA|nr:AlNc14C74G5013 [Albugo laibachii Nc14]|eukprot:CCA19589.1 AlNc14C74G5013 [Albugo laibachii Nc14]